jgi:hypothetical protein
VLQAQSADEWEIDDDRNSGADCKQDEHSLSLPLVSRDQPCCLSLTSGKSLLDTSESPECRESSGVELRSLVCVAVAE